jgi:hypothetical protein
MEGIMLKKTVATSLMGIALWSLMSLPAGADTAVIQTTTQDTYVEGENNRSTQLSEQVNVTRSTGRTGRSSTGIVQDVYQGSTVLGEDNDAYQRNSQVNVTEEIRRGAKRDRNYGY